MVEVVVPTSHQIFQDQNGPQKGYHGALKNGI